MSLFTPLAVLLAALLLAGCASTPSTLTTTEGGVPIDIRHSARGPSDRRDALLREHRVRAVIEQQREPGEAVVARQGVMDGTPSSTASMSRVRPMLEQPLGAVVVVEIVFANQHQHQILG